MKLVKKDPKPKPPVQRPKCPRCWNKHPKKKDCGYCGGQGRV